MGRFTEPQRRRLLTIARSALTICLARGLPPADAAQAALHAGQSPLPGSGAPLEAPLEAALLANAACFVTLWSGPQHRLRGCRGEFTAHQPLVAAVAHMVLASALDDPRFPP